MNSQKLRFTLAGAALLAGLGFTCAAAPGVAQADVAQPAVVSVVASTPAEDGALAWARAQQGSAGYQGWCLQFVYDAYAQGSGIDIGTAPSALDYWNNHPESQHPGDVNPPAGALVFWGATSYNPYGHVGISESGDTVISSEERSTVTVHEFSIADRNAGGYPYLGWILPA